MKLTSQIPVSLDADGLAGERSTEINFLAVQAQAAATGDDDGPVVKRIVRLGDALIGSGGFLRQGQVHALVAAVLERMAGANAFDTDP